VLRGLGPGDGITYLKPSIAVGEAEGISALVLSLVLSTSRCCRGKRGKRGRIPLLSAQTQLTA